MWFHLRSLVQLAALSIALAVVWRAEVELHGWDGLIWISYFHWAVPVGVVAFLAWVATSANAPSGRRRWVLLALGCVYAAVVLNWESVVLTTVFYSGAFDIIAGTSSIVWIEAMVLASVFGVPLGAFVLARLCGATLPWWSLVLSLCLSAAAGPAAVWLLRVVDPAHADDIHAVKTGAAVPFVVFALGVPWAARPIRRQAKQMAGPSAPRSDTHRV
jgi:hypothetical protein